MKFNGSPSGKILAFLIPFQLQALHIVLYEFLLVIFHFENDLSGKNLTKFLSLTQQAILDCLGEGKGRVDTNQLEDFTVQLIF